MPNQLKTSMIQSIIALRQQGWSFTRIAQELGIHRQTVADHVRAHSKATEPVILTLAEILVDESLGLEIECVVLLESLGQVLNIRPALPALWKIANSCPKDRAKFVAASLIWSLDNRRAAKLFTIMDELRSNSPDETVRLLADEKLRAMATWRASP